MKTEIEKAIRETLVIENSQSINIAVDKILKVFENNKSITRFEVIGEPDGWIDSQSHFWSKEHVDLARATALKLTPVYFSKPIVKDWDEVASRIENMKDDSGREGCTYGDTQYDSLSAVYGYNLAIENIVSVLKSNYSLPSPVKQEAEKELSEITEGHELALCDILGTFDCKNFLTSITSKHTYSADAKKCFKAYEFLKSNNYKLP